MAGTPLFMRDVLLSLKIGASRIEFQCDLKSAAIEVEPGDEVSYPVLCEGGSYSSVGKSSYALHLVAAQRWSADGLAAVLWEHEGELAEFHYQAHGEATVPSADAPGFTGEVRLIAGAYGGEVDTYAELDVTLPCTAKPTMISAAFPAAAEAAGAAA